MLAPLLGLCLVFAPQQPEPIAPQTVPEASAFAQTSRLADVLRCCRAACQLPHGDRLALRTVGTTAGGHEQLLVQVSLPDTPKQPRLRALVIGNIHGGEVEGKEALQLLVREFASGEHTALLEQIDLWLLPVYNGDGNEAIAVGNRQGQNGPDAVGQRPNGNDLDLNRDFVKVDAKETRTLLGLMNAVDPHLFVDLHTTNGSYHGYHLTYAPSLSPNVDPAVAQVSRQLLDHAEAAMRTEHGFQTFDYGNFETRDWDGGGAPESATGQRGWYTYDSRPRYCTNGFGLRNRIGVLSEAYSYCDFATRIAATRAFVLCLLQGLVDLREPCERACRQADDRLVTGESATFGFATKFAAPELLDVLVGEVDKVEGKDGAPLRFVRKGEGVPERMQVVRGFRATEHIALPTAWAVLAPTPDVVDRLTVHGVQFETLTAPRNATAERFAVANKRKPKRPFQGHQELVLDGSWEPAATFALPAGTIVVPARQRLARVAATLLEPQSEDSLSSWNFFEAQTDAHFPVLRVVEAD